MLYILVIVRLPPVADPSVRQVVGRQFYLHAVAGHHSDVILPYATGKRGSDVHAVVQLHTEPLASKRLAHRTDRLDDFATRLLTSARMKTGFFLFSLACRLDGVMPAHLQPPFIIC